MSANGAPFRSAQNIMTLWTLSGSAGFMTYWLLVVFDGRQRFCSELVDTLRFFLGQTERKRVRRAG